LTTTTLASAADELRAIATAAPHSMTFVRICPAPLANLLSQMDRLTAEGGVESVPAVGSTANYALV
jgi:hypothetical protein